MISFDSEDVYWSQTISFFASEVERLPWHIRRPSQFSECETDEDRMGLRAKVKFGQPETETETEAEASAHATEKPAKKKKHRKKEYDNDKDFYNLIIRRPSKFICIEIQDIIPIVDEATLLRTNSVSVGHEAPNFPRLIRLWKLKRTSRTATLQL